MGKKEKQLFADVVIEGTTVLPQVLIDGVNLSDCITGLEYKNVAGEPPTLNLSIRVGKFRVNKHCLVRCNRGDVRRAIARLITSVGRKD